MKNCIFCGEQIQPTARKCRYCQSFQDPADAPGPRIDIANLVVGIVGLVTLAFAVLGGLFGYMGFNSLSELRDKAEEASEKLVVAEAKIEEFTTSLKSIQARAEAVMVQQFLTRANVILDQLELDSLDRMPRLMFELSSIEKILNQHDISEEFVEIQREKTNMLLVIFSIKQYKDGKFDAVVTTLDVVPDDVLNKHRVMQGAYHKLYIRAREAGRNDDVNRFVEQIERHAIEYQRLARHSNKRSYISKVNLAGTRILVGKYADARKILDKAIREQPYESIAYYNLAALEALQEKLGPALTALKKAKERGEITTEEDIQYFLNDPDFQKLRNSDDSDVKTRLRHLLSN